jgi:hypothetical protein
MKKNLRSIGFVLSIMFCLLSCDVEYKRQGLKHPSQLHNIIIVDKYCFGELNTTLLYYDLKDRTFKSCDINNCYKDIFNIKDTIK